MNKSELSSRVAADASLSQAAAGTLIDAVFSTISEALARGETVAIARFGTFSTQARADMEKSRSRRIPAWVVSSARGRALGEEGGVKKSLTNPSRIASNSSNTWR